MAKNKPDGPSAEILRDLFDGVLPWGMTRNLMSSYKDDGRFPRALEVLQARVSWPEKILLPIGEHLSIVQKGPEGPEGREGWERIVKCDCGHEFGDYRRNWKLQALVRIRADADSVAEVYPTAVTGRLDWMELREFICPGCAVLLETEVAPPGFPPVFDFLPDLDAFYRDWLGRPLPDISGGSESPKPRRRKGAKAARAAAKKRVRKGA